MGIVGVGEEVSGVSGRVGKRAGGGSGGECGVVLVNGWRSQWFGGISNLLDLDGLLQSGSPCSRKLVQLLPLILKSGDLCSNGLSSIVSTAAKIIPIFNCGLEMGLMPSKFIFHRLVLLLQTAHKLYVHTVCKAHNICIHTHTYNV